MSQRASVEVVVCVHNSPEDVAFCLDSVSATLSANDTLIIVDDGSAEETRDICRRVQMASPDQVRLIRRDAASGFCKAANAGLRETSAEMVILLNSDTIVVGDWIDRLAACMAANWQIGIVGPLSNSGGWQSIPFLPTPEMPGNPLIGGQEAIEAIHAYCARFGELYTYPLVEQINGFCYALSRDVIRTVGLFDEESFPMGYGEESDFTLRALDAGFLCAVAVDCFVYHAKTKSYSAETREKYNEAGQRQLRLLHGKERVEAAAISTHTHPVLTAIRADAADVFARRGWTTADRRRESGSEAQDDTAKAD
ncbi:MAG: glycosyltransferase family 2 protein [Pseudomonadota bacterium]